MGRIIDIGCGGLGAIGMIYKDVFGVDKSQSELNEAYNGFYKILMDYSESNYEEEFFDAVTFYFSLMYMMKPGEKLKALKNSYKDLKENGKIYIWDINISNAFPDACGIQVKNDFVLKNINTTSYSIICRDYSQTKEEIIELLEMAGFKNIKAKNKKNYFFIEATK